MLEKLELSQGVVVNLIQPDVMDGVPDECGYYLVRHKETTMPKWFQANITIRADDGKYIVMGRGRDVDDPWIEENEFNDYLWTERIGEPDEQ